MNISDWQSFRENIKIKSLATLYTVVSAKLIRQGHPTCLRCRLWLRSHNSDYAGCTTMTTPDTLPWLRCMDVLSLLTLNPESGNSKAVGRCFHIHLGFSSNKIIKPIENSVLAFLRNSQRTRKIPTFQTNTTTKTENGCGSVLKPV